MNWNRGRTRHPAFLSALWLITAAWPLTTAVTAAQDAAQDRTVLEPTSDPAEVSAPLVPKYSQPEGQTSVETQHLKFHVEQDEQDGGKTMPREIWVSGHFGFPGRKAIRPAVVSLFFSEMGLAKEEHEVPVLVRWVEKGHEASLHKITTYNSLYPGQWPVTVSGVAFTSEEFIRLSEGNEASLEIEGRGYSLHIPPSQMPFLRRLAQAIPEP